MTNPHVSQKIQLGLFLLLSLFFLGTGASCANESVRFSFEWIELEFDELTKLAPKTAQSDEGLLLRDAVEQLIVRDKAEIVRTLVLNAKLGRRAKAESIDAYVYPEQFTVPKISSEGTLKALPVPNRTGTKNLGITVELDSNPAPDGHSVSARISHTLTTRLKNRTWGSGIASVEMPQFHELNGLTQVTLANRKPKLIGTLHPAASLRSESAQSKEPRLLLFVTAQFTGQEIELAETQDKDFLIRYEFFQTDLRRLNQWLVEGQITAEGAPLRSRLRQAVEDGEATLVESAWAAGSEGPLRLHSITQVPFPSDYSPPETDRRVPAMPGAFEFWNVGLQITCEAKWQSNGILRLYAEEKSSRGRTQRHFVRWNQEIGEQRWMEGVAEVAFPLFHEMNLQQSLAIVRGEVVLLGTMRPHAENGAPALVVFATMH